MKKILYSSLLIASLALADQPDNEAPKKNNRGFIYGAGIAYQQQIYKGFDQRTIAIPVIGYQGEKLNIFGPFINYQLYKSNNWQFEFTFSPRFNGFDESDSEFFIGMDKRSDSADAGFNLQYNIKHWRLGLKALTDVLSKSDGSTLDFSVSTKHRYAGLIFEPKLSVEFADNKLNDYYYGVTQNEATAFRSAYNAGSTINQSLALSVTKISPIGVFRLDLSNTWYGSEITDSPLVDSNSAFSTRLFFIRGF